MRESQESWSRHGVFELGRAIKRCHWNLSHENLGMLSENWL